MAEEGWKENMIPEPDIEGSSIPSELSKQMVHILVTSSMNTIYIEQHQMVLNILSSMWETTIVICSP